LKAEHDGSDLQTAMNVDHHPGQDILPNMTRAPHVKYITYYEDAESLPGWRTAVWELDKGVNIDFCFISFYITVALLLIPVVLHCKAAREPLSLCFCLLAHNAYLCFTCTQAYLVLVCGVTFIWRITFF
jgi:hypothetical protein